jgi:hypothetical protein
VSATKTASTSRAASQAGRTNRAKKPTQRRSSTS